MRRTMRCAVIQAVLLGAAGCEGGSGDAGEADTGGTDDTGLTGGPDVTGDDADADASGDPPSYEFDEVPLPDDDGMQMGPGNSRYGMPQVVYLVFDGISLHGDAGCSDARANCSFILPAQFG